MYILYFTGIVHTLKCIKVSSWAVTYYFHRPLNESINCLNFERSENSEEMRIVNLDTIKLLITSEQYFNIRIFSSQLIVYTKYFNILEARKANILTFLRDKRVKQIGIFWQLTNQLKD